jgi:hypothetical protein
MENEVFNVSIYTIFGKLIASEQNNKTINVEEIPAGTYILKVISNNKVGFKKIVIY